MGTGYERRTSFSAGGMRCPECSGPLTARRTCLQVALCCDGCGGRFRMEDLAPILDDEFEEELGFIPVDRL